jgi:hypothetical protein
MREKKKERKKERAKRAGNSERGKKREERDCREREREPVNFSVLIFILLLWIDYVCLIVSLYTEGFFT